MWLIAPKGLAALNPPGSPRSCHLFPGQTLIHDNTSHLALPFPISPCTYPGSLHWIFVQISYSSAGSLQKHCIRTVALRYLPPLGHSPLQSRSGFPLSLSPLRKRRASVSALYAPSHRQHFRPQEVNNPYCQLSDHGSLCNSLRWIKVVGSGRG